VNVTPGGVLVPETPETPPAGPVSVEVRITYTLDPPTIGLDWGREVKSVTMTADHARDLALGLRQAANQLDRDLRAVSGTRKGAPGSKKKRQQQKR